MKRVESNRAGAEPAPIEAHVALVVQGNNAFALDLYRNLRPSKGNLFFSPYSVATALAMTYAGARGNTAAQMVSVLQIALADNQLHPAFAALGAQMQAVRAQGEILLKVANALWPQTRYPFLPAFLALLQEHYRVLITPVDYTDEETARNAINAWVAANTQEKIVELIPRGSLDPLIRLVLTNAIYFKGHWASQFDPALTKPMPFAVGPDQTIEAPMMRQRRGFRYGAGDGLQVLELPYAGDALAMFILLPDKVDGLAAIESALTLKQLTQWLNNLQERDVEVFLPQFKISHSFKLNETLKTMGMVDAFDERHANFAGMDGNDQWLYIAAVLHKAFIDVNEEGTEAAAATAVVMKARSMPMPTPIFRADHPFIFLIGEKSTGSILLLGRVVHPQRESL